MNRTRVINGVALAAGIAAAVIAVAGGARWLMQRPLFTLQRIEIRGELRHVTAASLRVAIAGRLKGNYFTLRLDDARRLLEQVPWVAAASVRRGWPNRLVVTLTEHRALGVWSDGRVLSDAGVLFAANPAEAEIDGPLPVFDGPAAVAGDIARRYGEFAAQLAPLAIKVNGIDVSERRSWTLRVAAQEGTPSRVELGRDAGATTLNERLAQIVAAYPMVVARVGGPPERIDARYPNGFAATPPALAKTR
jgi:cell division protein FtsQ